MGYTLQDTMSGELLNRYCSNVIASIKAHRKRIFIPDEITQSWETKRGEIREFLQVGVQLDDQLTEARAELKVANAYWKAEIITCSSDAFHASGKKSDRDPYQSLFGTIKAKAARSLGYQQAYKVGSNLIARAQVLNHPDLKAPFEKFAISNELLQTAGQMRDKCKTATELHTLGTKSHIEDIQKLIHSTEVELLKLSPGNNALVRTILSPRET